jgi:hypothetical protein
MADRMSVELEIGGLIPRRLVDDLIAAIRSEELRLYCDEGPFRAATADELLKLSRRDGTPGTLHLQEHEVAWGHLEDLEEFLVKNGIAFDRWTEAKYEYDAEVVQFRRGMRRPVWIATLQNKEPVIAVRALKPIEKALARGQADRALKALKRAVGRVVPPLEPLRIVDEQCVLCRGGKRLARAQRGNVDRQIYQ